MDLSTQYLGLNLKNPIIASASPLSRTLAGVRELEDAGAAAVVLFSLFAEQVTEEDREGAGINSGTQSYLEAMHLYPRQEQYRVTPDEYLDLVSLAKRSVSIPVIGSLNGVSAGGWTRYAQLIEEAGADALELNLYYLPTDGTLTGATVEQMYIDTVRAVKQIISCPLAVKVGPYFSSFPNMAYRFAEAGADALVLFNRFYQPDWNLETGETDPHIRLSHSEDLRLALRWVALLNDRVPCQFAVTGGVHTAEDVLKAVFAGASATQMTSELLQQGTGQVSQILSNIAQWLENHGQESLAKFRGVRSFCSVVELAAHERAGYTEMLHSLDPPTSGGRYDLVTGVPLQSH